MLIWTKRLTLVFFVLTLLCAPATKMAVAQNVISDVSKREVPIEWDFHGAKIILFGAIDSEAPKTARRDVIIALKGPATTITSRKKERIAGIWINNAAASFRGIPSYYSIISNRPLKDIAPKSDLAGLRLGLDAIAKDFKPLAAIPQDKHTTEAAQETEEFKQAVIRLLKRDGLFSEDPYGVSITGNSLFRADISLPANVPVGRFTADIFLFTDGKLASRHLSSLRIHKHGIERTITSLAFDYPFLYGIICVVIAITAGLGASFLTGRR